MLLRGNISTREALRDGAMLLDIRRPVILPVNDWGAKRHILEETEMFRHIDRRARMLQRRLALTTKELGAALIRHIAIFHSGPSIPHSVLLNR